MNFQCYFNTKLPILCVRGWGLVRIFGHLS